MNSAFVRQILQIVPLSHSLSDNKVRGEKIRKVDKFVIENQYMLQINDYNGSPQSIWQWDVSTASNSEDVYMVKAFESNKNILIPWTLMSKESQRETLDDDVPQLILKKMKETI